MLHRLWKCAKPDCEASAHGKLIILILADYETFLLSEEIATECSPTRPRVGIDDPGTGLRASGKRKIQGEGVESV